jgi:hypothetical protein
MVLAAYPAALDDSHTFLQLFCVFVCVLATNIYFDWNLAAFKRFEK